MDIWDALRIIIRRWYVVVPVLILFVAAAFVSSGQVDAEYRATADLILLGPHQEIPEGTDVPPQQINTFLTPCSTCETVAKAITLTLMSSGARGSLAEEGWSTDYTLSSEKRTPMLHIEATSRRGDQAVGTVDVLIDRVGAELETRQTDVNAPEGQRITTSVLQQDERPAGNFTAANRVKITLTVVGLAAAAAAAFVIEGGSYYLGLRRKREEGDDDDDLRGNGSHAARHSARPTPSLGEFPPPMRETSPSGRSY